MSDVPRIFDRALLRQRQHRASARGPATFLLERAADDLADRLATIKRAFPQVLDYGTPGPDAIAAMMTHEGTETVASLGVLEEDARDLEAPDLPPARYDCIVSLYALQAINDLPGVLLQIRRALKPDGLFIAALAGGQTLHELRSALMEAEVELTGGAAPRVSPFADVRTMGQLLQRAGFALPVADGEVTTVRYASALDLMVDLRDMAATNILIDRSRKPLRRAVLLRAAEIYAARFADADGRIRATFETVWLSGWAPHESQQKPLKPGSATVRLEDALKAAREREEP
jgi:SAM-dependent methyltransferase